MREWDNSDPIRFAPGETPQLPRPNTPPEAERPSFGSSMLAYHALTMRLYREAATDKPTHDGDVLLERLMFGCWPSEVSSRN